MTGPPTTPGKVSTSAQPKQEEEDLDELDDLLDQFTPAPAPVPPTAKPLQPQAPAQEPAFSDAFSDDFEAALVREMEAMMRKAGAAGPSGPASAEDMATAWQKMLIGELEGTNEPELLEDSSKSHGSTPNPSTSAQPSTSAEDAFQRTIRQAMDKIKESDANARTEAQNDAESIAQLLKELGEMGEEGGDEAGLQGIIEGMMGQLMSKEILYEPLVELDEKFPTYFAEHPNLSGEERKKYEAQHDLVKRIITVFNRPNYSDDNPEMTKEVLELMNQMQELGSPPAEILGDVPPGLDFNAEGVPKGVDKENCVIA